MPDPPHLIVEDEPAAADLALLEERVAAAVTARAGIGEEREFGIFLRDDSGHPVAGISALVWGGNCALQAMWVAAPLRGRGLGRDLMEAAEREARRQGCALVTFHAYDLVARGLYEHLGYETIAALEGCPPGSATRWYRKTL